MKNYKLSEVRPRIFLLDFKEQYAMCMQFLRYQEYYESASPEFRGKSFKLLDFMDWYSHKYGNGVFTYTKDWGGFNIPGYIIPDVVDNIQDLNQYDEEMCRVWDKCFKKYPDLQFYIIGSIGKGFAMKHEIAHGFFYTQPEYKKKMTGLVKNLKKSLRTKINQELKRLGYTPKVYIDECQAYLSTGFTDVFRINIEGQDKPFVKLYNEYYEK
jgi:hypothetical protein